MLPPKVTMDDMRWMPDQFVRIQCLDLAMTQARNEGAHGNIDRVVEIATVFYNHVTGTEAQVASAEPEPKTRKAKVDKVNPFD